MSSCSRRDAIGLLSLGVVSVAMAQHIADAAEEKPLIPEVLTPEVYRGEEV
jgi:hypothetical protein